MGKDELRYETLLKLFFGHEAGVEQALAHIEAFIFLIMLMVPNIIWAKNEGLDYLKRYPKLNKWM